MILNLFFKKPNHLDIVYELTRKELRVRYKHHFFGYFWSIANPLAFALVYFVVFKLVMKVKVENFPLFLITGVFPWQWISNSVGASPMTFVGNASLIKKVNFDRNLLPFVISMQDMIHFIMSIPVIFAFMLYYSITPSLSIILLIPCILCIQLIFTYSAGLIISTLNLFFRDLEKLIQIFLAFLFYFTPVVYSTEMIPEKYQHLIVFNPAASIIICWRSTFLKGSIEPKFLIASAIWSLLFWLIAKKIYNSLSWRFGEVV